MNDYTMEEKRELKEWIDSGHSENDNPWYMADEKGSPMDFISAYREVLSQIEQHKQQVD